MTEPYRVGHLMLSTRGEMLAPDAGFCALLDMAPEHLVGRSVLEVTAPADRAACAAGMAVLRETRRPFVVSKSLVRGDGSIVPVEQTTAVAHFGSAAPQVIATVVALAPAGAIGPAGLLAQARFLRESRQDRDRVFGTMLFGNPSWDLLLKAYIAEAEGRAVDIGTLAHTARIPPQVALRWANALAAEGLLEIEGVLDEQAARASGAGTGPKALPQYRLSSTAHEQLESYLLARMTKLVDLQVLS